MNYKIKKPGILNDRTSKYQRYCLIFMCFLMVLLTPFSLRAQFSGGSGTPEDPYQVATVEDLNEVRGNLSSHFIQIADIDLGGDDADGAFYNEGEGWLPISFFSGVYNGGGHVISGLYINRSEGNVGLFGMLQEGSVVHHLGIEDADISGPSNAGALAGDSREGRIYQCYATGSVTGNSDDWINYTGLLVGRVLRMQITDCYAIGTVAASRFVGGLTGNNNSGVIQRCYAAVRVEAGGDQGGLVSFSSGSISASYWDTDVALVEESGGGIGFSTEEMTYPFVSNVYQHWDFGQTWGANSNDNEGYPFLLWQGYHNEGQGNVLPAFSGGDGSKEAPFEVGTPEQLDKIRNFAASYFIQVADIDLGGDNPEGAFYHEGEGWLPINNFSGEYNGRHHIISGLFISREASYVGLFGTINAIDVRLDSIILEDVDVSAVAYTGGLVGRTTNLNNLPDVKAINACHVTGQVNVSGSRAGGLAGEAASVITNCSFNGEVTGTNLYTGGLVGYQTGGSVSNSGTEGTVQGENRYTGGLIGGTGWDNVNINESYFKGDVVGENQVGGLVGQNRGSVMSSYVVAGQVSGNLDVGGLIGEQGQSYSRGSKSILNSYAIANVEGNDRVGGLIGDVGPGTAIFNTYAVGEVVAEEELFGGLFGRTATDDIHNSYWDTTVSGLEDSDGGEGRPSADMTYPFVSNIFTLWNFEEIWGAHPEDNDGYPFLRWQSEFSNEGSGNVEFAFEGAGTQQNPYRVGTKEELDNVRRAPFAHFIQVADIDLEGGDENEIIFAEGPFQLTNNTGWEPIRHFTGSYDGDHYTISGLYINQPEVAEGGLFHEVWVEEGAVTLKNINLEVLEMNGGNNFGALAGVIRNVNVINCQISGGQISGLYHVGGMIGELVGKNVVNNCVASNDVSGMYSVGGLIGYIEIAPELIEGSKLVEIDVIVAETGLFDFLVNSSFSEGMVSGDYQVGGLVGYIGAPGKITNTYARGDVMGMSDMGGLVGVNENYYAQPATIEHSYSTGEIILTVEEDYTNVGGFAGNLSQWAEVVSVYWDTESSGASVGVGNDSSSTAVTGRTTAQMTIPFAEDTYQGWDFQHIWDIREDENDGYPILRRSAAGIRLTEEPEQQSGSFIYYLSLEKIPLEPVNVRIHADCDVTVNGEEIEHTLTFMNDASALEQQEVVVRLHPDAEISDAAECFIYHDVRSEDAEYDGFVINPVRFIIHEEQEERPRIVIYNAISPNGDGKNDFLYIENIEFYEENRVAVFTRWGDLVVRIEGYNNTTNFWMPGDSVLDGEYVVVVTLDQPTNNEKTFLVVKR